MTKRILVAEDDANIRMGIADTLESEGFDVFQAEDGQKALAAFRQAGPFCLVMLDVMMPGTNGYDVCREIRRDDEKIPIIIVTAKTEEIDTVVGLNLGADDYVTKPFGVHELLARVHAQLRRRRAHERHNPTPASKEPYAFGEAQVDPSRYLITREGKKERLTPTELKLLECFRERPDTVLTRDALLNAVWGVEYYGTSRTLDQHVARLRKKVEPRPADPTVIITVHGVGYRYIP